MWGNRQLSPPVLIARANMSSWQQVPRRGLAHSTIASATAAEGSRGGSRRGYSVSWIF